MSWPTPQDYNEAIQNTRLCFADPELQHGSPVLSSLGLPKVISGAFASVYQMHCSGRKYAVRCFTHYHRDQEKRYEIISKHLQNAKLSYMVDFSFLKDGIKVRGQWYPILKMEWLDGETLDTYIEKNLRNSQIIQSLSERFLDIVLSLRHHSIAHSDLQHGNILVVSGDLRLIDYDGMYVPGLEGMPSHEFGHRNYQHPRRTEHDFAPYLDNFSTWVIYLSLLALSAEPDLWFQARGGDEQLLFSREDFEHPALSHSMLALRRARDSRLGSLITVFETLLHYDLAQIPPLAVPQMTSKSSQQAPTGVGPDWLTDYVTFGTSTATDNQRHSSSSANASWIVDHLEPVSAVSTSASVLPERLSLAAFAAACWVLGYTVAGGFVPPVIAASTIGCGFSLLLLLFTLRFRHMPEVSQRKKLANSRHQLQREVRKIEEDVNKIIAKRDELGRDERKKIDEIRQQQHNCAQKEQQEINRIERVWTNGLSNLDSQKKAFDQNEKNGLDLLKRNLQTKLTNLSQQRQGLNKEETAEVMYEQQALQSQALISRLTNYSLESVDIPGIGLELKKRLSRNGIKTAADIANVYTRSTGHGRHTNEIAYIEVPSRGSIHVEGVGPKKAAALLSWRQQIVSRLQVISSQPLPLEIEKRIRTKYQERRRLLDIEEADIKRNTERNEVGVRSKHQIDCQSLDRQRIAAAEDSKKKQESVRVKYQQERESLEKKVRDVQDRLTKEREELDKHLGEERKALSEKQWELAKIQRDVAAYRQVSLRSYLKRILSVL